MTRGSDTSRNRGSLYRVLLDLRMERTVAVQTLDSGTNPTKHRTLCAGNSARERSRGRAEASRDSTAAAGDIAPGSRITARAAAVIRQRCCTAAESSRIA